MRVAYLVNQYPKVSHTFIRREILALEERGVEVERFSIRPGVGLIDPDDRREQLKTRVVLRRGVLGLLLGLVWRSLTRPVRMLRALSLTLRVSRRSGRGLLRHVAYLGEACLMLGPLKERGCQHLHAHFGTNSTAVAMLCRVLGGPPYSFTVHGQEELDLPGPNSLINKIRLAAFVVAISSYGRSQLLMRCEADQWDKVHVVHCGLDPSFLEAPVTPVPEAPRLVCLGRLCVEKGQLLLVEALAALARDDLPFELVMVGDGELRPEVEGAIARHGLGARVRITGWAGPDVVHEELRAARALVLPSFSEGLPVAIMEAMALGRPVLSTYVGGIPELVREGECGWVIPAGSLDDLTRGLRAILEAPCEELERMGEAGRRRVEERHDVRVSAKVMLELLRGPA